MAKLNKNPHKIFAKLAAKAESEGKGYNDQIGMAAWAMRELNVPPREAVDMIRKASANVTRREPGKGEIERWVNKVYQPQSKIRPYDSPDNGVKVKPQLIEEFANKGSIDRIRNSSSTIPSKPSEILEEMYNPESLLHITPHWAQSKDVMECEEWCRSDLSDKQFICPAHLKSKDMGRCIDNVLHRKFVVYESDRPGLAGEWDRQAGCIERLAQDMPLRLVVWSGSKSLHAWFDISTRRKDHVKDFLTLCCKLGADPAALRPAQLVRMPWGIRRDYEKKPQIQKVLYFN